MTEIEDVELVAIALEGAVVHRPIFEQGGEYVAELVCGSLPEPPVLTTDWPVEEFQHHLVHGPHRACRGCWDVEEVLDW